MPPFDAPYEIEIVRVLVHRCRDAKELNTAIAEVLAIARQHGIEQYRLGRTRGYTRRTQEGREA